MKPAAAVAVAAVAGLLLPGCLEPFSIHVDPAALAKSPGWTVTPGAVHGGTFGPKSREMRYSLDRATNAPPPFSGSLQVFSIRSLGNLDGDQLLALAHDLVKRGAQDKNITLQGTGPSGTRTIASGVPTHWFVEEGQTTQAGDLFEQGVRVRILGEVGHDGRSGTSLLVIGMAQISRTNQCPIVVNCQPEETNLQTWIQLVGDPHGTIQGATSDSGFVQDLVTR